MIGWTLNEIARAVGGELREEDAPVRGVSTDTRTLEAGSLFVAIRGERFDGHDHIDAALDRGAAGALCERVCDEGACIVVNDTVAALGALAAAYRATLRATVIGVTGSAGKTTTCRMLDAALGQTLRGTCSVKSFNNAIGVPLTILSANEDDGYLVCEIGTSEQGEIAALSAMARPDIGVITSIGRAHLEGLGDLDGVRCEKSAIGGGVTLIPAGDDALRACFPPDSNVECVEATNIDVSRTGTRFDADGERFEVALIGAHHAHNAAFAVRVAQRLGIDTPSIREGLAGVRAAEMRFETHTIGGVTIVNDAYNANPESMIASLRAFNVAHSAAARRVVVLGDMLELGSDSGAAHEELGTLLEEMSIDSLVCVGAAMSSALGSRAALVLDDLGAERVAGLFAPGDAVLLKGSRGIGLERVLDAWRERVREGAPA